MDYDAKASSKLETQLKKGSRKIKLSSTHYVELKGTDDWWQVRYDDPDKRRGVRRVMESELSDKEEEEEEEEEEEVMPVPSKNKKQKVVKKAVAKDKEEDEEEEEEDKTAKVHALVHSFSSTMSVVAASLKASLEYPDNWQTVESMLPVEVELSSSSPEFKAVQRLMNETIAPIHVNTTVNHILAVDSFTVTRVVRVQNPILWVNYHNRMNRIIKKLDEQKLKLSPLKKVLTNSVKVGVDLNR